MKQLSSPFLNQVQSNMRMRGYSIRTEKAYLYWIKAFIIFQHKRHPDTMGAIEVAQFLATLQTHAMSLSIHRKWHSMH